MLIRIQRKDSGKQNGVSVSSPQRSPEEYCREGNASFQGSLRVSVMWYINDDKFPMKPWCRILREAGHQLTMPLILSMDPSKSSFEVLHQSHNYNADPFIPLGCKVEMNGVPSKRKTWEAHTKAGFYLGNSWENYICHEIWIMDTRSVRVGQTVCFQA